MHLEGRIKGILMCYETSMDVLNKRSLLTLVYVYIYRSLAKKSQRNSIFSRSIPTDPNRFFEIHVRSRAKYLQSGNKNGRGSRFIFVGEKKRAFHGWTIIRSRIGLNLVFLKLRFPPTVRNNARERGKRQVRSLECLQMAKKIGRLLSLDARRG